MAAALALAAAFAVEVALWTPWHVVPAVPGGPVPTDPAAYFSPAERARAAAFRAAVHPPAYAGLALALGVTVLLGWRLGPRLARHRAWRGVAGAGSVTVLVWALPLPLSARAHQIDRAYGLSTQGWGGWFADEARSLAITLVVTLVLVAAFYLLVRRLPRWWWLVGAALAGALVVGASFAYPLVVEPVFASFHRLPAGPVRASVLALARRDHVRVSDVLVSNASVRTTELNAYVSGFGATRRIVLYDTLLRSAPPREIRVIVAHELGHAKFGDVWHGTVEGATAVAFAVTLLGPLAGRLRLADPRYVARLLATVAVLATLAQPVQNLLSRHIEARADWHALALTRDPAGFRATFHRTATRSLADLDPPTLTYVWFSSHPTAPQRLAMSVEWARLHPGAAR